MQETQQPLLTLTPQDEYSLKRLNQVLQALDGFPEVIERIQLGNTIKEKRLEIIAGQTVSYSGYNPATHQIFFNPNVTDYMQLLDVEGRSFPQSSARFFAHVIEHSTQTDFAETSAQYGIKRAEHSKILTQSFLDAVMDHADDIRAVFDDEPKIRSILTPLYDTYIGAQLMQTIQKLVEDMAADPIVARFNDDYESPAIRFENLIATKYLNEPERGTDYLIYAKHEIVSVMEKETFIATFLGSLNAARNPGSQPSKRALTAWGSY